MGAWGFGPFENDDALDWVIELAQVGVVAISGALADVHQAASDGYIDVDYGSRAIAACEITAASLGHPLSVRPDFDGMLDNARFWAWVDGELGLGPQAAADCLRTIDLIANPETSEVAGLWLDAGALLNAGFLAMTGDLQQRLEDALQ